MEETEVTILVTKEWILMVLLITVMAVQLGKICKVKFLLQ